MKEAPAMVKDLIKVGQDKKLTGLERFSAFLSKISAFAIKIGSKTSPETFLLVALLLIIQYLAQVSTLVSVLLGIVITIAFAGIKSKLIALEKELKEKDKLINEKDLEIKELKLKQEIQGK